MQRPLAVYVLRTPSGDFLQAKVSRTPPDGAEVHLRTHDDTEARKVAERLAITLASIFDTASSNRKPPLYPS